LREIARQLVLELGEIVRNHRHVETWQDDAFGLPSEQEPRKDASRQRSGECLPAVSRAQASCDIMRIGGMQLFQTESSDRSERILPRVFALMLAMAGIYFVLIIGCALTYAPLGMTLFDAICHAFPTLATGGFSTRQASAFSARPTSR
jgi:hypothetical protein